MTDFVYLATNYNFSYNRTRHAGGNKSHFSTYFAYQFAVRPGNYVTTKKKLNKSSGRGRNCINTLVCIHMYVQVYMFLHIYVFTYIAVYTCVHCRES